MEKRFILVQKFKPKIAGIEKSGNLFNIGSIFQNFYEFHAMPTSLTIESLIIIANYVVLPQWILMILLPKWKWTQWLMDSNIIPFFLGAIYFCFFIIVAPKFREGYTMITFFRILFSGRKVFLVLWLHILIFDLVVGSWICKDAVKISIAWWSRILSLILVFFTGPIGFIFYEGIVKRKTSRK